jgi:hypothetical protein
MAQPKDFYVRADMHGLEIMNQRLHNVAADPVSPNTGRIWYNTSNGDVLVRSTKGATSQNRALYSDDDDFYNRLNEVTTVQDTDYVLIYDDSASELDHQGKYRKISKSNFSAGIGISDAYSLVTADSGIASLPAVGSSEIVISGDGSIIETVGSQVGANKISLSFLSHSSNKVLASPASGPAGTPSFRSLVDADMPVGYDPANWTVAYQHSLISSGNPHNVDWSELVGSQPAPIAHTHVVADITDIQDFYYTETEIDNFFNGTTPVNAIRYNVAYVPGADLEGLTWWNPTDWTMNISTGQGPVLQVNQESVIIVYNNTGSTIPNGKAVYPVGGFMGRPSVALANASTHVKISGEVVITTMDIPDQSFGICTRFGKIRDIDTTSWGLGDTLWVSSTTDGDLTNVRPEFPHYAIQAGGVTSVDVSTGDIIVGTVGTYQDTVSNFWNGTFRETFDFLVTSNGTTVTGSLSPSNGNDDMTMMFSDGFTMLTTTPAATITLTPGPDNDPAINYVYIPRSTKVLTVSTTDWPTAEHIKVATIVLRSAAKTQTDGALRNQNHNDHIQSTNTNQGHLSHIGERIRQLPAAWDSGVEMTISGTPTDVYVAVTSGVVYQMHRQTFPAIDMQAGGDIHVVNNFADPYVTVTNLNGQTSDSLGNTLNNTSFTHVYWAVANKSGEASHLMCNLPSGSYSFSFPDQAVNDPNNYTDYTIPKKFQGVGFLLYKVTYTYKNGVWVKYAQTDLRGFVPNTTAGGGVGGTGVTTFLALTDTPSTYVGEGLKAVRVNAGGTALEFVDLGTIYYTETEINDFFSGATPIPGYEKTNWDAAYTHSQVTTGNPHQVAYEQIAGQVITLSEIASGSVASPGADKGSVFIDSSDNGLKYKSESDVIYDLLYAQAKFGTKQTGVDSGILGEVYFDDDYMYICVVGGGVGVAIWKKTELVQT